MMTDEAIQENRDKQAGWNRCRECGHVAEASEITEQLWWGLRVRVCGDCHNLHLHLVERCSCVSEYAEEECQHEGEPTYDSHDDRRGF